jgi:hypothetical protein
VTAWLPENKYDGYRELAAGGQDRLVYYALDLLWRDGDLRKLPQIERKQALISPRSRFRFGQHLNRTQDSPSWAYCEGVNVGSGRPFRGPKVFAKYSPSSE